MATGGKMWQGTDLGGSLLRSGLLGCSSLLLSGSLGGLGGGGGLLGGSSLLLGGGLGGSLLDHGLLLGSGGGLLLLLRLDLLLGELGATRRTLGLLEDVLVDTVLQGLVEQRVEHLVRDEVQLVVGLDILLERLTAVGQLEKRLNERRGR